ncbi:MAG: hypothetical protein KDC33_03200 [Thermoleophilia bacterium]|nr:hypothetical protein [Thermoleophilia bacterium]
MVNGRVLVAGVLVAAAYLKGRIDAATQEAERRDASDTLAVASAETAATLTPQRPYVARPDSAGVEAESTEPAVEEIREGWRAALEPVATPTHTIPDMPLAVWAGGPAAHEPGGPADDAPSLNEYDAPVGAPAAARPEAVAASVVNEWDAFVAAGPGIGDIETFGSEPEAAAPAAHVSDGDFFVSGMASAAGDLAFGRVLFAHRLDEAPAGGDVTLIVEASENLPEGGVAVMSDGGFAPCVEGMTLVAAAAGPGRFVARGRFVVRHPEAH